MCLPHCPTYQRTGNEAESPRGRIALAQALARGQLPVDDSLSAHLDHCLGCRACEAMCPSEVRYGLILGHARRLLTEQRALPLAGRAAMGLLSRPAFLRTAVRLGASPLATLATPFSPTATRLTALAKARPQHPLGPRESAGRPRRGRVGLFLGCTGEAVDSEALAATEYVLAALGFDVERPSAQVCCGAIHHTQGNRAGFERLAYNNLAAFDLQRLDAVVSVASGCTAMLREFGQWLEAPQAAAFSASVSEITGFLAGLDWADAPVVAPLPATAAVHVPCTQVNVLCQPDTTGVVLAHIPALERVALPDNHTCCGAAGLHMLQEPATAEALREAKLDALVASGARYLVTTNIGCALHLAAGARERGLAVEVIHPVTLLARQLALAAKPL